LLVGDSLCEQISDALEEGNLCPRLSTASTTKVYFENLIDMVLGDVVDRVLTPGSYSVCENKGHKIREPSNEIRCYPRAIQGGSTIQIDRLELFFLVV